VDGCLCTLQAGHWQHISFCYSCDREPASLSASFMSFISISFLATIVIHASSHDMIASSEIYVLLCHDLSIYTASIVARVVNCSFLFPSFEI